MYDEMILKTFLDKQLDMYPEEVASTYEEAEEFLSEICAAVCDTAEEVMEYLEDVGVDTEGMGEEMLLEMPEVMSIPDGRYLILEV